MNAALKYGALGAMLAAAAVTTTGCSNAVDPAVLAQYAQIFSDLTRDIIDITSSTYEGAIDQAVTDAYERGLADAEAGMDEELDGDEELDEEGDVEGDVEGDEETDPDLVPAPDKDEGDEGWADEDDWGDDNEWVSTSNPDLGGGTIDLPDINGGIEWIGEWSDEEGGLPEGA